MKYEKSCGSVIYKFENNSIYILLIKHNKGHWSFPKGHMENGETEYQTAIREVKEETNLDIKIYDGFRYVTTYSPKENVMKDVVYFLSTPINNEIKPQLEEVQKIEWINENEAKNIITYKEDIKILDEALNFIKTKKLDIHW